MLKKKPKRSFKVIAITVMALMYSNVYAQQGCDSCIRTNDSSRICLGNTIDQIKRTLPIRKHINDVKGKASYEYFETIKRNYASYEVSRWFIFEFETSKLCKIKVLYSIEMKWNMKTLKELLGAIINTDKLNITGWDIENSYRYSDSRCKVTAEIDNSEKKYLTISYILSR